MCPAAPSRGSGATRRIRPLEQGESTPPTSTRLALTHRPTSQANSIEEKKSNSFRRDSSPRAREPRYLSWDEYFMALAFLSAQRSKDPNKQVGACIVNQEQIILGIGYNGFPRGCKDFDLPWSKESPSGNPLDTKFPYVCHAEMNAILNSNHSNLRGSVSAPPSPSPTRTPEPASPLT